MTLPSPALRFLPPLLFAILGLALYWHTLPFDFVFDDKQNIVDNPHIRIDSLSLDQLREAGFDSYAGRRPLANISFAINYLLDGTDPWGYRLVNIIIHIVNGGLIYWLLCLILKLDNKLKSEGNRAATNALLLTAAAATLVWFVHPLQVQSVTYIVQRMTSLATMFMVLSLCLYVSGRRTMRTRTRILCFIGAAGSWIVALGCKEIAIIVPLQVYLIEWYFFRDLSRTWLVRSVKVLAIIFAGLFLIVLIYLEMKSLTSVLSGYKIRDFTPTERVMTQFRVLVFYLSLLFWPHPGRMTLDHHFPPSQSLLDPTSTLVSLALLLALLTAGILLSKKHRLYAFCILWFFLGLVLESSILPLEMAYEHRMYLPSILPLLGLVLLIKRATRTLPVAAPAALLIVVSVFCIATTHRNRQLRDAYTLWADCVVKTPYKARPLTNFGFELRHLGRLDEAETYYRRALKASPNYPLANNNLAVLLADRGDLLEATEHYQHAIKYKPNYASAYDNLGVALVHTKQFKAAFEAFSQAKKLNPKLLSAYTNMGNAYLEAGNYEKAIEQYGQARTLRPKSASVYNGFGAVYARQEKFNGALAAFKQALANDPGNKTARQNYHKTLGSAARQRFGDKQYQKALIYVLEIIEIDANNAEAYNIAGACFGQLDDMQKAVYHFKQALAIDPKNTEIARNLEGARILLQRQQSE